VAFAIGAEVTNVTVANYPFVINPSHGTPGNNGIIGGNNTDWMYLLIVSLGFFVLMLLIIAIIAGNSRKKKKQRARERAAAAAAAEAQAQAFQFNYEPPAQEEEEFVVQKLDDYNNESKGALLRKEIKEFSHTNPDVVAQLLRSMLREE
ncbi:MAG: flagellar M-ring protein FliF, partial [Ruminiclostridium sp.]|nr:flagellar M-ring protein FliF [Ruminiclostridium sp.]